MKKKSMPRLLVAIAFLGLSACATPQYKSPQFGKTVTLTVEPIGAMNAFAYQTAATCSGRQMILSTKDPVGVAKSVQVPAGEPLSITLVWDTGTRPAYGGIEFTSCAPTVTFTPSDGETYFVGPSSRSVCSLSLRDSNGSAVAYDQRSYSGGATESSSFCR
jgi:hypothetical protein